MILNGIKSDKQETRRTTIQRLNVGISLIVSPSVAVSVPNLKLVQVKATLLRNGKNIILFQDNLDVLLRFSMYMFGMENVLNPLYYVPMDIVSTNKRYLIAGMIDLGSPINLHGNDVLTIEASTSAGWQGTNQVSADSSVEFEWRQAIGVEKATPVIMSEVVTAGSGRFTKSLGDNVVSVALVSTITASLPNDATKVWSDLTLTSDKINYSENVDRMLARRNSQFESHVAAQLRGHTFKYVWDTDLDNVQLNITTVPANVVGGEAVVVWQTFLVDQYTAQRAATMEDKHEGRNYDKFSRQLKQSAVAA